LALRIEDIDTPRVKPDAERRIREDLEWLGLDWDDECHQSDRFDRYANVIERLDQLGLVYLCDCSRAEIARVASAPHAGEEGPIYPGTCRPHGMQARAFKRPPCVRFAVPEGREVGFDDLVLGPIRQRVDLAVGDFVLRRGDGVFAYQLAVVVDDADMQISRVVRGADLLSSTPRQLMLFEAIGAEPPSFLHTPLVLGADGERLAKRAAGVPLRDHREAGTSPEAVVGALAFLLGLADDDAPRTARSLLDSYAPARVAHHSVRLSPGFLAR
jgi:glutamyl-tRNA synthetase